MSKVNWVEFTHLVFKQIPAVYEKETVKGDNTMRTNDKLHATHITLGQRIRAIVLALAMLATQVGDLAPAFAESPAADETALVEQAQVQAPAEEKEEAEAGKTDEVNPSADQADDALSAAAQTDKVEAEGKDTAQPGSETVEGTPTVKAEPETGDVSSEDESSEEESEEEEEPAFEIPLPEVNAEIYVGESCRVKLEKAGEVFIVKLTVKKAETLVLTASDADAWVEVRKSDTLPGSGQRYESENGALNASFKAKTGIYLLTFVGNQGHTGSFVVQVVSESEFNSNVKEETLVETSDETVNDTASEGETESQEETKSEDEEETKSEDEEETKSEDDEETKSEDEEETKSEDEEETKSEDEEETKSEDEEETKSEDEEETKSEDEEETKSEDEEEAKSEDEEETKSEDEEETKSEDEEETKSEEEEETKSEDEEETKSEDEEEENTEDENEKYIYTFGEKKEVLLSDILAELRLPEDNQLAIRDVKVSDSVVTVTVLEEENDQLVIANDWFDEVTLRYELVWSERVITLRNPAPVTEDQGEENLDENTEDENTEEENTEEEGTEDAATPSYTYTFGEQKEVLVGEVLATVGLTPSAYDAEISDKELVALDEDGWLSAIGYFDAVTLTVMTFEEETYTVILSNPDPDAVTEEETEPEDDGVLEITAEAKTVDEKIADAYISMVSGAIETNLEATRKAPMMRKGAPAEEETKGDETKTEETKSEEPDVRYAAFEIEPEFYEKDKVYKVTVNNLNISLDVPAGMKAVVKDAVLYHFPDGAPLAEYEKLEVTVHDDGNAITGFEYETRTGFSKYVLKYTVEFHNGEEEVVIAGDSQILLSELIARLGLTRDDGSAFTVDEVESVVFADSSLFTVEQVAGEVTLNAGAVDEITVDVGEKDFVITSEQPFDAVEMTITLNDGEEVVVGVTDATYNVTVKYTDADGNETSGNITSSIYGVYAEANGNYARSSSTLNGGSQSESLSVTDNGWELNNGATGAGLYSTYNQWGSTQYRYYSQGSVIGDYIISDVTIDNDTQTVTITLKERSSFIVNIEFYDVDGNAKPDANLNDYYLLADTTSYTLVNGNEINVTTKDNAGNDISTFFEGAVFSMVKYSGDPASAWPYNALTTLNNQTKLTDGATVDNYTLSIPAEATDGVLTIKLIEQPVYTATINFYDVDENPDSSPDISDGDYYLLAKSGGTYLYYAQIIGNGQITGWKNASNEDTDLRKADSFEIVKVNAGTAVSMNGSNWPNPTTGLANVQNKITDGGTIGKYYTANFPTDYNPTDQNYIFTATKQPEYTVKLQFNDANGDPVETGAELSQSNPSYYYVIAYINNDRAFFTQLTNHSGQLSFTDVEGDEYLSLPRITRFDVIYKNYNAITNFATDNLRTSTTTLKDIDGNNKYIVSVASYDPEDNVYVINAVEISEFPVTINFYGIDGETPQAPEGTFSGYKIFAGIPTGTGKSWTRTVDADMTQQTSTVLFGEGSNTFYEQNYNPQTTSFSAGNTVNVAFNNNLNYQNDVLQGSDADGMIIYDSAKNAYKVTRVDTENNGNLLGVTYNLVLQKPYEWEIKKGENTPDVNFGPDSGYNNGAWYLQSTLTKSDGDIYYYVERIAFNAGPGATLPSGTIRAFYAKDNLSQLSIGNESSSNPDAFSLYEDGDTVTHQLVYVTSEASNYKQIITGDNNGREAFANGSIVFKYNVTTASEVGKGTVTLTKVPDLKLQTEFKDADGSVIDENIPQGYYLLIKMVRDGKTYYALNEVKQNGDDGHVEFYKYENNTLDTTRKYFYSGSSTLTETISTQVVTGVSGNKEEKLAQAINGGNGIVKYNENTVGTAQYSDLTKDLYSSGSEIDKSGTPYVMTTTFKKHPNAIVPHDITIRFWQTHITPLNETNLVTSETDPDGTILADGTYFYRVRLYNNGKLVAYRFVELTSDDISTINSTGKLVKTMDESGDADFILVDDVGEDIPDAAYVHYDANDGFTSDVRFYKLTSGTLSTLKLNDISTSNTEDVFEGYDFWYNYEWSDKDTASVTKYEAAATKVGDTITRTQTQLGLHSAYKKVYQVQVITPVSIDEDDKVYLYVEAKHKSTGTDKYGEQGKLVGVETNHTTQQGVDTIIGTNSNGYQTVTFVIEDQREESQSQHWTSLGHEGNTITGNETFTIYLTQDSNTNKLTDGYQVLINGEHYTIHIDTGNKEDINYDYDAEHKVTTITHFVTLKKDDYDPAITPSQFLGPGVQYGITADQYVQRGHTETNFAVRVYNDSANNSICGSGTGNMLAYAAEVSGDAYTCPYDGVTAAAHSHGLDIDKVNSHVDLYTTQYILNRQLDSNNHVNGLIAEGKITPHVMTKEEITDYVRSVIATGRAKSQKYKNLNTITPEGPVDSNCVLDTTGFEDNITIYVDATNLLGVMSTVTDWNIKKRPGQSIVLNIPGSNITLQKNSVQVLQPDGTFKTVDAQTNENDDGTSTKNREVDKEILSHIFFNLYEADNVDLNTTAGAILAPDATVVHQRNGASVGWILTGGTVFSEYEWHFYRHDHAYSEEDAKNGFVASKFMNRLTSDGTQLTAPDNSKGQTFTFVLQHLDWENGAWETKPGFVVTNAGQDIVFPYITYSGLSDVGTHYYLIRELNSGISGIEPDDTEFVVKDVVTPVITWDSANEPESGGVAVSTTYYKVKSGSNVNLVKNNQKAVVMELDDTTAEYEPVYDPEESNFSFAKSETKKRYEVNPNCYETITANEDGTLGDNQTQEDVIRFVNTYVGKYCVAITKAWNDGNDRDGARPDAIEVILQKFVPERDTNNLPVKVVEGNTTKIKGTWVTVEGTSLVTQYDYTSDPADTILLNDDNNWTHVVKGIDKYDEYGECIEYRWVETAMVFGTGESAVRITPVQTPAIDAQIQYDTDTITSKFTYYMIENSDGLVTFSADDTSGTKVEYTGTSAVIDQKTTTDETGEVTLTFLTGLTNTHETLTTEVEATKEWDDEDNKYGLRKDVKLRLIGEYTVDETEETTVEGKTITTVKQVPYEVTNMSTDVNPKTVPMYSMTESETTTYLTKEEYDALENKDGYTLLNNATVKWENLPKYYDGHEITYKVVEELDEDLAGYTVTIGTCAKDDNGVWKVSITNALQLGALQLDKTMFVDNVNVMNMTADENNTDTTKTYNPNTATYQETEFYATVTIVINGKVWYVAQDGKLKESGATSLDAFLELVNSTDSDKVTDAIHTITPADDAEDHLFTGLPFGEYTITEYVLNDDDEYEAVTADNGDINSMAFIYDISKVSDTATVDTVYNATDENPAIAEGHLVNAYTTGVYCIAVTKQWLTNGQVTEVPNDLELTVRLERSTDGTNWTPAPLNLRTTKTEYDDEEGTIVLEKANNWSAVAVGMDKMDAEGNLYSYRWVELNGSTAVEVAGVIGDYAVGTSETLQRKDITVDDKGTETTDDDEIVTMIFLTKLTNSNVEVEIPVQKLVNNKNDELFNLNTEFTVTIAKKANGQPDGDTSTLAAPTSITLHKNDKGEFVVSNITKEGTYTFEIQESTPAATNQIPGMTYDTEKKIVEVKVRWNEDNDGNKLFLEVEYIRWRNESETEESAWKYLEYHGDETVTKDTEVDVVNKYELCKLTVNKTATLDGETVPNTETLLYNKTFYVSVQGQVDQLYYATNGAVVTEDDRWVEIKSGDPVTWENLPAGTYLIVEQDANVPGYDVVSTVTTSPATISTTDTETVTVAITNAYTTIKTQSIVTKLWSDNNNQDGKRPTTVTMKLYANNEDTGLSVTLASAVEDCNKSIPASGNYSAATVGFEANSADNSYAIATVSNLPAYINGVEQTYTWIEDQGSKLYSGKSLSELGYTIEKVDVTHAVTGDTTTITNTYTPDKYCLTVLKVWNDSKTEHDAITVELYSHYQYENEDSELVYSELKPVSFKTKVDGTAAASATLNAGNNWTVMALGVDKYANGHELEYYWKETVPSGYVLSGNTVEIDDVTYISAEQDSTRVAAVINNLVTAEIPVEKIVTGDYEGIETFTVKLDRTLAEGETDSLTYEPADKTLELKENEEGIFTISGLQPGTTYTFTVQETATGLDENNKKNGMTYDVAAKTVTVKVANDLTVTYEGLTDNKVTITNVYNAEGTAQPEVTKEFDAWSGFKEAEFTFEFKRNLWNKAEVSFMTC